MTAGQPVLDLLEDKGLEDAGPVGSSGNAQDREERLEDELRLWRAEAQMTADSECNLKYSG